MRTNATAFAGPDGTDGLRPDPGLESISTLADELLRWGSILLVLAILGALAWWWYRRWLARQAPPPPPPPLPAHVRARHRLEGALSLLSDPARFCTELSVILREYLEERFGWNAPDRTTEEFLVELQGQEGLSVTLQDLLRDFLTRCDVVKFARYEPAEPELLELHGAAVRVVEDTVPPPTPVGGDRPAEPGGVGAGEAVGTDSGTGGARS